MSGCTLLHKFGKHTNLISLFPLSRNMTKDTFTLCPAFPVRNNLAFVRVDIFLTNGVSLHFTGIQYLQVFHTMASQLRKSRNRFRLRPPFTHNQLVGTNVNRFIFTYFEEVESSENRHGILTIVIFVEICFN